METTDALTLLEKRVTELEAQIFGKNSHLDENQTVPGILLSTNAMVTTALTRRETISSVLEKLPQLDSYMDPLYLEDQLLVNSKRQYIIELYPQLKQLAESIQQFMQVNDCTNSQNIEKVTSLQEKLDKLIQVNCTMYCDNHKNSTHVLNTLKQYNEIIMSLKVLFFKLDEELSLIESQTLKSNKKV